MPVKFVQAVTLSEERALTSVSFHVTWGYCSSNIGMKSLQWTYKYSHRVSKWAVLLLVVFFLNQRYSWDRNPPKAVLKDQHFVNHTKATGKATLKTYLLELHTFSVIHDSEVLLVIIKVVQGERPASDKSNLNMWWGMGGVVVAVVKDYWVIFWILLDLTVTWFTFYWYYFYQTPKTVY